MDSVGSLRVLRGVGQDHERKRPPAVGRRLDPHRLPERCVHPNSGAAREPLRSPERGHQEWRRVPHRPGEFLVEVRLPSGRRITMKELAFILSLLLPGAGHFLVGRFGRGIVWAVAALVASTVMLAIIHINGWLLLLGWVFGWGVWIRGAVDAARGTPSRPRWLVVIGAWAALVAGHMVFSPSHGYFADVYGGAKAFTIPSGSMQTTLLVGDRILVDRGAYRSRAPQRGDVVVFVYPEDE